ncbi:MAG: hypothetical protein QM696_01400 [Steroidobacteraceae bacterium]
MTTPAASASLPALMYLGASDIAACGIGLPEVVAAVRQAFVRLGQRQAAIGAPLHLRLDSGAHFCAKGGALPIEGVAVIKLFGNVPDNGRRGLPDYNPLLVLHEVQTGLVLAVMDGAWLTAVRTAALTATAAQVLAPVPARRLGLIGSGRQAHAHYDVLRLQHPLAELTVFSRNGQTAGELVRRAQADGYGARACSTPEAAIEGQDIVVSTIPKNMVASTGMLDARRLAPQAFVSMVDMGFSWQPSSLEAFDLVVSDEIDPVTRESREQLNHHGPFDADLAEVLRTPPAPRGRAAFIFAGSGLADAAVAELIWRRARERGLGTPLRR